MPDDSRTLDPSQLASDGDHVMPGAEPPTAEELEAAHAAELVRLAEGKDGHGHG